GSRLRLEQLQPRRQPFPYTTLFRSSNVSRQTFGSNRPILQSRNFSVEMTIVELLVQRLDTSIDIPLPNDRPIGLFLSKSEARPVDRKSTRLNSSHVSISHAAACLKKKKERQLARLTETPLTAASRSWVTPSGTRGPTPRVPAAVPVFTRMQSTYSISVQVRCEVT